MHQLTIIVKNVSAKWQGNTVLEDVSFTLNPKEHLLITGESGSGKTVLAKALTGRLFHNGTVDFETNGHCIKPSVLFVEQHYHFKNLSNVNSFYYQQRFNSFDADDAPSVEAELKKVLPGGSAGSSDERVLELLMYFDLSHRIHSPLLHLSSGEHKRFQLIKALLQSPQVILLDEPFTGLDIQTRAKLKQAINKMAGNGTTCILICDPADAPGCITHIAQLDGGRLETYQSNKTFIDKGPAINQQISFDLPPQELNVNFTEAVVFNKVNISYGNKHILCDLNWQVKHGDKWLLKGKNGAGKSTLLSLITGDNPQAYANDIYLFGKKRGSGESIWDIKKNIGYVSPELQWYFDTGISCYQAVASGFFDTIGLFRDLNHSQEKHIKEWLRYFELEDCSRKLLASLPAGKQRLALLARAMVKNPPVLILDEPCQGLDHHQKDQFIQITDAVCKNAQRTLIYVTHYHEDVPSCVNKVLELQEGRGRIYNYERILHTQN